MADTVGDLDAAELAAVVGANLVTRSTGPDQVDLDRIAKLRQRALDRFVRDRDHQALDGAIAALDREEAAAQQAPTESEPVPADVAVRFLQELPKTWARANGGNGRQLLASALFDRVDVLGLREATFTLSARGPSWLGGGAAG